MLIGDIRRAMWLSWPFIKVSQGTERGLSGNLRQASHPQYRTVGFRVIGYLRKAQEPPS